MHSSCTATIPNEAIVRAVNETVDNDTVGAIVGAAVGALHGASAFPRRWRDGLTGRTGADDDGAMFRMMEAARGRFWSEAGPAALPAISPGAQRLIDEVRQMKVHTSAEFGPSLKKPLLVLLLASRIARGHPSPQFRLEALSEELSWLITEFSDRPSQPPHPQQPFYHLGSSSFWTCHTTVPIGDRKRTPNPSQIDYGELSSAAHDS